MNTYVSGADQPFGRDGVITSQSADVFIANQDTSRGSFDPFETAVSTTVVSSQAPDIFAELPMPAGTLSQTDTDVFEGRRQIRELLTAPEGQTIGRRLGALAVRAHNLKDRLFSAFRPVSVQEERTEQYKGRHRITPDITTATEALTDQPFGRDGVITSQSADVFIANQDTSRGSFDPFETAVSTTVVSSQAPDIFAELPMPAGTLSQTDTDVFEGRRQIRELLTAPEGQTIGRRLGALAVRAFRVLERAGLLERVERETVVPVSEAGDTPVNHPVQDWNAEFGQYLDSSDGEASEAEAARKVRGL